MRSELIYQSDYVPQNPMVSIVIPTYNNFILLVDAINSIVVQENYGNIIFDIVVISNNPDVNFQYLIDLFRNSPISFYRNMENYGQVGNINQCAKMARGKYVSYLHDDDMLLPNYLTILSKYVNDSKQKIDCILPSYYVMYEEYKKDIKHHLLDMLFLFRYFYRRELHKLRPNDYLMAFDDIYGAPTCGTLFLKESLINYGYFKDERGAAWDFFNFRLFHQKYSVYILHEYVGIRRADSGMSKESKVQSDFLYDKIKIIEHEANNCTLIRRYKTTIISKKPLFKYMFFRLRTKIFYYINNLDAEIGVSSKMYKVYGKHKGDN